MNLLLVMTRGLMRGDSNDFAVVAGRPPCLKMAGSYAPITQETPSEDDILEMLAALGGVTYIDRLGAEATSWRANEDSLGPLQITAARRQGLLQARVVRREEAPPAPKERAATPFVPRLVTDNDETPAATPVAKRSAPPRGRGDVIPLVLASPAAALAKPVLLPLSNVRPRSGAEDLHPELDALLADARARRASDLHIVATRPPLFRIAGDLVPKGEPVGAHELETMLHSAIPARLLPELKREGSCDFAIDHPLHGRFRANVSRQRTGLKASLRLIGFEIPTLASLGLPAAIGEAARHHQGLIVVTGPTGHGKTSTLAAIVDLINTETRHHIILVEDPVEYIHPTKQALVSQREVGTNTRSYAAALKASLREDPDVIVVGELRDTETVRMALTASETGHLVIATMNTPSAAKTIDRLIDLFPPGDQPQVRMALAGGLRLIVSQRLVRTGDGQGVVAAAEVLPGSIALWTLIRDGKTYQIPSLQQRGKGFGIVRLDDSLAELVRAGKVALEEASAYAESPEELTLTVTGKRRDPQAPRPS